MVLEKAVVDQLLELADQLRERQRQQQRQSAGRGGRAQIAQPEAAAAAVTTRRMIPAGYSGVLEEVIRRDGKVTVAIEGPLCAAEPLQYMSRLLPPNPRSGRRCGLSSDGTMYELLVLLVRFLFFVNLPSQGVDSPIFIRGFQLKCGCFCYPQRVRIPAGRHGS